MNPRLQIFRGISIYSFLFMIIFLISPNKLLCKSLYQAEKEDSLQQEIRILRQKISLDPENPILYQQLGHLFIGIAKYDTAMVAFRKCIDLDENSAEGYNGLGLAYHKKGETSLIPIQVLMELFKIDNYSKAERHFKHAMELNPDYLDPLYNLGVNYVVKGGYENYERSVETLKMVLEKDMEFKDADFMLGIAFIYLEDFVNAEVVLKRVIEADRTVAKAMLRLSDIYFETGREDKGTEAYYDGIVRLRDRKMWEEIYAELEILMETEEKIHFETLNMADKGILIRKIWKSKDPVPTTIENERLIEHYRRVNFARNTYPDVVPPYYDDRGKVYVKYGSPDNKYTSQMTSEGVKDNESWSYEKSIRRGLTFDFVKKGVSYYRVQSLEDATPTGLAGGLSQWEVTRRLYVERADFSESYNMFLLLTHKTVGDENPQETISDLLNIMINFNTERDSAQSAAPAEVYFHQQEEKQLPFVYNLSQFRGDQGESRVEVYLGVSNNRLEYQPKNDGVTTALKYHAVLQDSNYNDVFNESKEFGLRGKTREELTGTLFLHQENYYLKPGTHLLAIQLENPQGKSKGIYRNEFLARDFRGNALMVSDIQMSSNITQTAGEGKFVKQGLNIMPYPYTAIRRQLPIFIYLEIYNLKFDVSGRTNYTVTHQVDMLEYKKSIFSKTFGAIGRLFKKGKKIGISTSYQQVKSESETFEYLSLDMGKLPVGIGELTVSILDNTSGESASRSIRLQIIE